MKTVIVHRVGPLYSDTIIVIGVEEIASAQSSTSAKVLMYILAYLSAIIVTFNLFFFTKACNKPKFSMLALL